jgi:ABC-type Mn2+/Zn2+ transport system permease subunit
VFSAALAVGALLATGEQLIDALFGAPGTLSTWELVAGLTGATAVIAFMLAARDRLVLLFLSSDVARTAGIDVQRLGLLYLLAFALTVALGLRFLGALLMGSLIIIPAATARQVARNLDQMLGWSVGLAVFATVVGAWIAESTGHETGPIIVIVAASCFVVVTAVRRR